MENPGRQASLNPLGNTGLRISSISFSAHRLSPSEPKHEAALRAALLSGVNYVETSSLSEDGAAQRLVGQVIGGLRTEQSLLRENLIVADKLGYIQGSELAQAFERAKRGQAFSDTVRINSNCWYCVAPDYLRDHIAASLERLRLEKIDLVLLHDIEILLRAGVEPDHFESMLKEAFQALEGEVDAGRIGYYGISSAAFTASADSPEFLSLEWVLKIARQVSSNPRFAVVQVPLNLLEAEAALRRNQPEESSLLQCAQKNGLGVLVSRPLQAMSSRGKVRLASFQFYHKVRERLQEAIHALRILELERPSVDLPLEPMAWVHELDQHWEELGTLSEWRETVSLRIQPGLNQLGFEFEQSLDSQVRLWGSMYLQLAEDILKLIAQELESRAALLSQDLEARLVEQIPALKELPSLSQKALAMYLSLSGVSSAVVGLRDVSYVQDALSVLEVRFDEQEIIRALAGSWYLARML